MLAIVLVLIAAGVASYTDLTRRKIPNALVASLLVCGLAARAFDGGTAVLIGLGVFAIVLGIGMLAFALGMMGGGDVKFIAAASAVLGWPQALPFIAYTLVAGGVLALAASAMRGRLPALLSNLRMMSYSIAAGARPQVTASDSGSIPYALAILTGAICLALITALASHPLRFFS